MKLITKSIFPGEEYEKPYLLKMTANLCKDYLKSKRVKDSVDFDTAEIYLEHVDQDYTRVTDGRLYLVVGDECIDVTDQCGETSYYRYEKANDDGGKSVIFVGGTVENNGWIELVFDADQNYVFNQMKVTPDSSGKTPDWVNQAMHQEGVPCGDPELDSDLHSGLEK